MLPDDVERLWSDYLAAERVRIRPETIRALDRFVEALLLLRMELQQHWAREIARRAIDEREDLPIRLPLFRGVLFPALLDALKESLPGSARWLAGFAQLLYKSPECWEQLPPELQTEYALLGKAVRDDPSDLAARKRLVVLMRSRFEYALHELPAGVLYGHDSASVEECDLMLEELSEYEKVAGELGRGREDMELIKEARFHIPAYRRYLSERHHFGSYEEFLSAHARP